MTHRLVRLGIGLVALTAGAFAVTSYLSAQKQRKDLLALWTDSGIKARHPTAFQAAARLSNTNRHRLALARALVSDSLDLGRLASLTPEEASVEAVRIQERLDLAQDLARTVVTEEPSSWESETVLGGVHFLTQLAIQSPTQRRPDLWQQPLERARYLAPNQIEPQRFLAASYLTRWYLLSDDERRLAQDLLRKVLVDPESLRLLLPAWMAIADKGQLFPTLPDSPIAWSQVTQEFAQQHRWEDYCEARDEWTQRVRRENLKTLAEADARRTGGDIVKARDLYLRVIRRSEPSRGNLEIFSQALTRLPAGPISEHAGPALRNWVEWALPLWLFDQPTLPASSFQRLSGFDSLLEPHSRALSAIAAGNLIRAETIERRVDAAWSEVWGPYVLGKALFLLRSGLTSQSRATLQQAHRSMRSTPLYHSITQQLEPASSPVKETQRAWLPSDWLWRGDRISLAIEISNDSDAEAETYALDFVFDSIQPRGTPFEIQRDGSRLGCWSLSTDTTLTLGWELEPGLHSILLTAPARGIVQPGTLTLSPTEDSLVESPP